MSISTYKVTKKSAHIQVFSFDMCRLNYGLSLYRDFFSALALPHAIYIGIGLIHQQRNHPRKERESARHRLADSLFVVLPGFEPRQAEPKTAVLPLHHKTILFAQALVHLKRHKVRHLCGIIQIFLHFFIFLPPRLSPISGFRFPIPLPRFRVPYPFFLFPIPGSLSPIPGYALF